MQCSNACDPVSGKIGGNHEKTQEILEAESNGKKLRQRLDETIFICWLRVGHGDVERRTLTRF